jgi:hypothetical protein
LTGPQRDPYQRDRALFVRYADLRSRLETLRERCYFDEGFRRGRLSGLAEARQYSSAARTLVRRLTETVIASTAPPETAITAVLEYARALLVEMASDRSSTKMLR